MGVATDLTQFQESIEDVEMGAIHALLGNDFLHSLLHAGTDRLVEIALGSFKLERIISVLGGSSVATSVFFRRSMSGPTRLANKSLAFSSFSFSMG